MYYIVKCWIPVDEEDPKIFNNLHDAQGEYDQATKMQPKNHYKVTKVDKDGVEI